MRTSRISARLALSVSVLCLAAHAQEERPRIGLVLSGGGARGAAHIGVLQVLEAHRVPVDAIAGTSMGAIVGALYASGWSPNAIQQLFETTDWNRALSDRPVRRERSFRRKRDDDAVLAPLVLGFDVDAMAFRLPQAVLEGRSVENLLEAVTAHAHHIDDFDELPIPFRCVAADLVDGSARVFESGPLSVAVRASMSLPAIFAPVRIGKHQYVDGGIVDNLPVDVVRAMGVDVVIAVDVAFGLAKPPDTTSVLDVTDQVISILVQENLLRQRASLRDGDVLIDLKLEGVGVLDFQKAAAAIAEGREAGETQAPKLDRLAVDEDAWDGFLLAHRRPTGKPRIMRVRLQNDSRLGDELLLARIHQPTGETLDLDRLQQDLSDLSALDVFQHVGFRLDSAGYDRRADDPSPPADLVITAKDRALGPHYFQFGLDLANDFQGGTDFTALVRHTWLPANRQGGEWRNELRVGSINGLRTEFYQPLDRLQRWFVEPSVEYLRRQVDFVLNGIELIEADIDTLRGTFAAGRVLGNFAEIRAGYIYEQNEIAATLGLVSAGGLLRNTEQRGLLFTRITIDDLDSIDFPRSGIGANVQYRFGNEGIGSFGDVSLLDGRLLLPLTAGDTTFLTKLEGGYSFRAEQRFLPQYQLGGFTRLSGLQPDELLGDHFALANLTVYHRLSEPVIQGASEWFVGGSTEWGTAWTTAENFTPASMRFGGSLFVGARSPLGPFYFGVGATEEGRYSLFVYLGRRF
ncbi:MAG: patatin-like phospholipase family protein [Planctomycetes bacterium]|nr:patatin-like phospholipase family protein [Planctomycetota bacterium]